jgi:hypothetical protein
MDHAQRPLMSVRTLLLPYPTTLDPLPTPYTGLSLLNLLIPTTLYHPMVPHMPPSLVTFIVITTREVHMGMKATMMEVV